MLTLGLFISSKLAQANTNKLTPMSVKTPSPPYVRSLKQWVRSGFVLLFCLPVANASQIQAPLTPIAASKPSNLPPSDAKAADKKTSAKPIAANKPEWAELTAEQKIALKPLFANWRFLGETSKRKWIALSVNFQMMAPAEQTKLHARMNEWVALSQQERTQARLNFAQSKQLPQSHKAATWEAYQALSQEEKAKLARVGKDKKTTPPVAMKNNQTPKLSASPVKIQALKVNPPQMTANLVLDSHTLLLRSQTPEDLSSKN
jgi:hypothetical protein